MGGMDIDARLRTSSLYRRLSSDDRSRIAGVMNLRSYEKGDVIFREGDPSDVFFTVASGRVKIVKALPNGREVLLETFGPGDPFGAVAAYDGRPFPASAVAIEPTSALLLPRRDFFALLEQHPTLVRGLLSGLTQRLVELTARLGELSGGRVETRLARLLLKLADTSGRAERGGIFIPLALSRQELADMTGTTIESCIRVMSRWGKQDVVRTDRDGFVVVDRAALEDTSAA
jgi:CRP/FNR family transcriptional regulator